MKDLRKIRKELAKETGINIPVIPLNEAQRALYSLSQGPYRIFRAMLTVTLQTRREVEARIDEDPNYYATYKEYLDACIERPSELDVHARHMKDAPENWDKVKYTPWPKDGILVIWMRLPSSNRSWTLS